MPAKGGNLSFRVPVPGRITAKVGVPVTIDGNPVSVPANGLRVQIGQRVGWLAPEGLTRVADELRFHFD